MNWINRILSHKKEKQAITLINNIDYEHVPRSYIAGYDPYKNGSNSLN